MNNGRRYAKKIVNKSRALRKQGKTHREIAKELKIAVGTACLWTKGIVLTNDQKKAILSFLTNLNQMTAISVIL